MAICAQASLTICSTSASIFVVFTAHHSIRAKHVDVPELTSTLATVGACKQVAVWLVANNILTMEDMPILACKVAPLVGFLVLGALLLGGGGIVQAQLITRLAERLGPRSFLQ